MSKNKDDEFDFEWDDESSFDSSLDNFGGDVDDYTGEEIKDAKNDRSPVIEKIRSVTPSINAAGRAFTAGAGKGIGKAIENDMPSVYQAYQQGTHILSEARIARQEINDKFKPWWNDTKRAIRRLSQQLEGQMPFGLDKKILKLVGEEDDDQQYKQPSKEALRQEQMDSNINQIFELQMQKSMEQQKDTVLNRAYDRRVDAIRHKESAGFLSKIAESAVYQQAFTSSVFTAYLKKDLELKYKQFYATEDILGVMTNHAKAVDLKLEAVIKNTALPEADKVYMSERLANAAKEKLVNSFSDKVSNYFSKMRENVVDKFKELLDFGELIPELFNSQSDILEMMNDEDMKEFGGSGFNQDSIFTKRGMMGLIFGKAGGSFAQRMFRKFTKLLPQETMASIENYFGGGWNGLALLADDIARGRIKSVPSGIRELIRAVAPNLRDTTQTVLNEGWQNRDAGGKITNRFIQVVQDVIPGYLKMQTRYLEILATGKDSGLLEWDYKKHEFRSQKEMYDELNKSILVDREYAELRIRKGAGDTTNLIAHVTAGYRDFGGAERDSMIKALKANTKDIELFKINLAHSEEYYRITGDILKDLEAIATGEDINVIQENELYKIAFKGINNPIPVAGFWLDLLSDRTQTGKIVPNQIAINDLNRYLTEERMNNSGRFARMMESHIKEGHYFMTGAFGAKQDSSGDWNIDEAALFRQQLGAARSRGGDLTKAITDPEKLKAFNELFGQIQYEEKNKKNWVLDVIKGVKEKISKFNITDFADDILKDPFISAYKKMFGDGKNADKEAEEAWKKVVNSIEEAKKFGHEIYDNVTGAVKKAWDDSKVKTVGEALSLLGSKVDKSFNELRRKLEYKEDGETKLKSISDLTDDDWFDWFSSIDNIDTVLRVFGGNEAISHIMRSILPNTVQVLLLAVRDNTEVFKQMRTERQKSSGTDIASVTRRTAVISKLAKDAISEKKKDMDANRHSSLWKPGKNNGNMDKAAYTSLVEDAEKGYSVERESLRLDETKLTDPIVDINKTQLDILKNIDIQLGDFYHAFIDVDFRNKALSELRKSEGKLVGDHENFYKGQDEAVSTAYGKQIAHWTSMLNDPTMKQWHQFATTQLQMLTSGQYDEQYQGRESYEKYNNRSKDAQIEKVRENAVYGIETGFNVDNVELRSGAVLRSDDELLAAFNRLQTISKSKLTWTDFRAEQHNLDRRKHYIRELEKYLKKIDDKNSIQAVLISWIIDNKAWLLKNASNYIPDVALFEIIRNTIIYAMDADSISLKKAERNLSLVLVRSPQSTGRRSEDLIIGYIQEFLPLYTKDILTSAAQSTVSEYAHMKNLAEVDVMGSAIEGTGLTGNRNLTKAYGDMYNEAADKISYAEDGDDHYSSSPEYVNDLLLYHTADAALKGVRHASDNSRMGRLAKASEDTTKRDLYSELARVKNLKQNALEYGNINYKVAAGLDKREADARYGILKQMHGPISKDARRQMWQAMYGKGRKNKKKYASGGNYTAYIKDISGEDVGNIDLREYRKAIKMHKNIDKLDCLKSFAESMLSDKDKQIYNNDKYTKIHELYKSLTPSERKLGKTGEYGRIKAKYNEQSRKDEVLRNAELKQFKYGKYLNLSNDELQKVLSTLTPDEQAALFSELNTFVNSETNRFNKRLLMIPTINSRYNTEYKLSKPVLDFSRYNIIRNMLTDYDKESIDDAINLVKYSPAAAAGNTIFVNSSSRLPEGVLRHEQAHLTYPDAMPTNFDVIKTGHEGRGARYEKHADWHAVKDLLGRNDIKGVREFIDYLRSLDPFGLSDIPWRTKLIAKASKRYGYDLNQGLKTKKYAKGGNIALAYSKQLLEDRKLDAELRKKYKYGKYFDEKYSNADLVRIRSSLSPQEQQIFDAECADFSNNWIPRFINRLKPFRSSRWEKHTNGIPVIDANKINQNIEFSPWDREYIDNLLNVLTVSSAAADPYTKIIWARSNNQNKLIKGVLHHEASHIVDKDALPTANISIADAHSGRGARFEKHADWNAVKRLLAAGDINGVRGFINWLQRLAKEEKNDPYRKITDVGWRANLLIRAAKRYGYDLNQGLKTKKYAKGDNISFDLPIDQYGGYVDQPTEILGGSGIAGEAGGETILPHKFNERFKELIYRCLRDTVGENIARRVLGMLNPSETTEDKLGILLSDNDKVKFASGGSTAAANANVQTDTDTTNKKDEYTRKHPTDTIKNILLNIMESNEAIYSKLGDGLLVVDLASALDKLKNSNLMNKLKNLKIGERIKSFLFGTDDEHKGLIGNVLGFGKRIAFGAINNAASFGRHLVLSSKVCDVFLKSDIEGQVHGDKKISAAELKNGTIFSDAKCTKPIYSVADIYPPVYRKKIDENGNTIVEEAITKEEAKPGLVDEQGNPLTYLGGKIGRFLHNIFMKPINAIFSKSALEKISNIGSSITSGIRHGFAGLFGAYCDVYSARDPDKMLVSGTSIKEGRLVRIPKEGDKPKVVPTVFDIDGECWIMVDDPDNPGQRKLGDKVIYNEDITAGLQHKDGTPIESSKISLAMSKLRRLAGTLGEAALSLTGGALRLGGTVIGGLWKAGGWLWRNGKEAVVKAFTAKNKYIDVCVIRNNEKKIVMHADELKENKATKRYCYMNKEGEYTPVLSAYGISAPVYDMRGSKVGDTDEYDGIPVQIISQDDVDKQAIFDNNGNKLTEWAGRSLVGKIGFGAIGVVKFGWDKLKKIGKGIWNVGKAAVGAIGSILGEGGAAVTSIITNAWNSTIDLFKNTVISKTDLQEIVGNRLLDIYGLLYKYMPRRKYVEGDKDGDGDVDGSWEDYEQKRKERESKREQERLEQWYKDHPNPHMADNKEGFLSRLKGLLGFGGDKDDDGGSIGDYLLNLFMLKEAGSWVGGKFKKAGKGIGKLFGKLFGRKGAAESAEEFHAKIAAQRAMKREAFLNGTATKAANVAKEPGKIAKAWNWIKGLFGKKAAADVAAEEELARLKAKVATFRSQFLGKAAAGKAAASGTAGRAAASAASKGLFKKLATMFGTRIAAQAAVATSANAAPVVGQIASAAMWALTGIEIAYLLSKDSPKTKNMRAIRCKGYGINSKYWEAIIDLETDTFDEWVSGNQSGVDRDRLRKFGYKVDFMNLSGDDSSKVDYLSAWYRQRFTPMYQFYLSCMRSVGAEFESSPPKDDAIPEDRYAVFVNEFTKHVDKFCNGPARILRLDKSSYTSWLTKRRALEQEEGLSSSKYNDANLRDTSISNIASKYVGNASDHFAYARTEFRHGNVLNAMAGSLKGIGALVANTLTGIAGMFEIRFTSNNEKAWDKVRLELYGLNETDVRKDEYKRITNIIKEFEMHQVHVIDGEQQVLDEELTELAEKLFPAKVRSDIKSRLALTSGFTDDTSKDLSSEAKSFTISWYKRIFLPIFTAYAQVVRTACGDGPGDNINIDSIPEENRLPLLKDFERQSKQFLSRNIDTEILRMSSDGLYTYLIRRSEEDKTELAKDATGLLTEEDIGFTDKLSKSLNQAGKDFSDAWDDIKHRNVIGAIGRTLKGTWNTVAGIFGTVGTSIVESISDFLHGSSNKHRWETRFYDYGFVSTEGSSDPFASTTNNNISAMVQFENEAGRLLLEDNTGKPADEYFISIMLNTGYLDKCCKSLFGANGTDATLETLNSIKRTLSLTSSKYMLFAGPAAAPAMGISNIANLLGTSTNNAVSSLATLKKYLTDMLTSEISESKDKEGKANDIKQKISDMFNYIDFWYTFRFKPIFSVFVNAVSPYGVDMTDIDVDDIPNENRKEAYEEYQKLVRVALKKDNIQRWNLSPEGLAVYLKEINKYREDMKDGTLDDKTNPLAAYYKEKEDEYAREVVDTAIASMHGVSAEDKKHVVESLSKASVEIDNELNDVSFMASLSASDALKDLGVQNIFDNTNKVEVTAFGKLMELTTGYNNYDKKGVNSGIFFDDKLGEVFTDFTEDAHEYLYQGASGEDIHNALTKFMNVYLESKAFLDGQTQTVQILDTIMGRKYPAVAAENATYKYFANWFAHRFIPYYTYFVTLVNKANKVDNKEEPDLGKLTPMTRRYVILKLMTAEKKNLIPSRAQALKLTQDDMDKFYKREQALKDATSPGGSTQRASRSQLLKDLEDSNKALAEKIAKERNKTIADSLNNTTDSSSLSTVKAMDGVSAGAKVGDRFVKQKGRSLTEKERREVWDFLVGRMGLTETQAAAVMGNMMQESGLSCDVVNGIGATGICQWLGSRLYGGDGYIGLIPFAKAKGLDPNGLQAQLEYFEWEVTHNKYERKRFDDYVRNVTEDPNNIDKTIAECAVGFRKGFERCGEHEARDSRRVAYSKAFYNKFSSDKDIPKYADPYDSNVESMLSNLSVEETSLPPHIKQYGDNAITSTISSDETTGVSGGNSSLPSHIARYGNISATTAKACKTLTANSREKSIGKCAKYVADALQAAGYKFNRQPSAYMYHTNGVLSGMGFECIGRTNSQPQAGDICVINRFNGHPHGHICMFNGQQWISDFRQRTPVPYKVGAPGGLWYYRPSDNTSAGNSGEFITNGESASSSQDSVVNSTYNSIKTNDALLYSNAVDTIRNSLPEESTEQTPVYTYANMTGEGNNENIRTQNAIQNSITTANNGSAPVVAELQLISSILAGFRGDVNSFINTLLQGIPTQSSKGTTSPTVNKKGELVNNIDEKAIKDMGDKLLAYVTSALSTVMNTKIPNNVNNTSRALASAYPLNSSKRG